MKTRLVCMGVAGCGKSTVGRAIAAAEDLPLVEGDDFHSEASRGKMSQGIPLTDDDRVAWLAVLGGQLVAHPEGVVLNCSALKQAYRDQLRQAAPGLRFVFLELDLEAAAKRVAGRGPHFFSPSLVASQFATLESPAGEPGVLCLDALAPLDELVRRVSAWLHEGEPA